MKTIKVIKLTFEDGTNWIIPLKFVAEIRADYYLANKKDFNIKDYNEEIKYIMNSDYEGIDWLQNNMNFKDFENVLRIIKPDIDESERVWFKAKAKIIIEQEAKQND